MERIAATAAKKAIPATVVHQVLKQKRDISRYHKESRSAELYCKGVADGGCWMGTQ